MLAALLVSAAAGWTIGGGQLSVLGGYGALTLAVAIALIGTCAGICASTAVRRAGADRRRGGGGSRILPPLVSTLDNRSYVTR